MTLTDVRDWAALTVPAGVSFVFGSWVETTTAAETKYCVVQASGGQGPKADDRHPRYRLILLGRRNQRQDGAEVLQIAEALVQAAVAGLVPCGAANIRAITEPVGPGYTTELRAWAQVDFQVTF